MKIEILSGTGVKLTTEDGCDFLAWLQSQGIYCTGVTVDCIPGDHNRAKISLECYSTTVVIPEDLITLRRTKYAETVEMEE